MRKAKQGVFPNFWRHAENYLYYIGYLLAFVILIVSIFAISYSLQPRKNAETYIDKKSQFIVDLDNQIDLKTASSIFRNNEGTSLNKIGSLPFKNLWLYIEIPANVTSDDTVLIESMRVKHAVFWKLHRENGEAKDSIKWSKRQNGIALELPNFQTKPFQIIGKIELLSVNRVRILLTNHFQSIQKDLVFERKGGFLFGAFLMVAFFSYIVSFFYKDLIFFLFGTWLLTSLRIAAYNGDWDPYWLSIPIPDNSLQTFLRITYIAHSFISLFLFYSLFKVELRNHRLSGPLIILQLITIAALIPILLIGPTKSLMLLWILSGATILIIFWILFTLIRKSPSRELFWYSGSWFITLIGSIVQILYSLGFREILFSLANNQMLMLASALMLAITLAERMNSDKIKRISAQNNAITALQKFRQNYNITPVGIFSVNNSGKVLEHNPAFTELFHENLENKSFIGIDSELLLGRTAIEELLSNRHDNQVVDKEFRIQASDNRNRWFHIRAFRKFDRHEIWIEDISARKEAETQLTFLVNHDPLTGILNRRGVETALENATQRARDRVMCLAYVDLDRFKLVNDLFGHATGDQILRQMASRLRTVVAPPHIAARVGGDEFILIIDSLPLEEARSLCERLRAVLSSQPYQYQDKAFTVSASIGLIRILPGMTPADALTASDRACSEAKRMGGRSVVCFDSGSSELSDYLEEIRIVAQIKERLPIENFFLVFQPIISLRHPDAGLSYEALIRMRDANGDVQSPARFIPAAERNGLMTQIDRWVLRDMLEWLDEHPLHRDRLEFCTLNLSGASLNDEKFLQDTIAMIRNHRLASRKICFEITESVALYDLNTTRRFVDSVKFLGAKVALDDFGAGYTSFSYLKELPADFVKIDGNFIRNINSNAANYAIAHAIVELTRKLGMACVAEWAENDDIIHSLIELQVDFAQGFGLCGPVEREKILQTRNGITLIQNRSTTRLVLNAAITQSRKSRRNSLPH